MEKTDIIRLATFLYSEKEGIKKKTTVLKRVVEAIFIEFDNKTMEIQEIHNNILSTMEIFIAEEEINQILENKKNQKVFTQVVEERKIKYSLQEARYSKLKASEKKNIQNYIEEFVLINEYHNAVKDIIYRYIYYVFKRNIADFSTIIGGKIEGDNELEKDFNVEEQKIIKEFLEWDNEDKNEAILALMGCSLEYSMLTSDADRLYGTRLGNIFSSKILYIDTNIIYYCLGINGEEYRKANELLLDKCLKAKEKLRITKITELEFYNTLNHYIDEIKRYESNSLSRINYKKYICNEDIYLYYLEWKNSRKRYNEPEYFKKFLESKYRDWIKKYNIDVDKKVPYNEEDSKDATTIKIYTEEITYKGKINYDALNIYWVECLRKQEESLTGFAEEKYFILSPHKALKKWDMDRKLGLPLIVTPEIWALLLCRFISRSEDDFKSYINYINLKVSDEETIINNKQFYIIIKAIEEVTEELMQQETIIDVLVEEKFAYLQKEDDEELTNDVIYEKTKEKAEKLLSERVVLLEQQLGCVNSELEDLQNKVMQKSVDEDVKIKETANKEQDKAAVVYAREKLRNRKIVCLICSIVLSAILIWQLVDFFILKNEATLYWSAISKLVQDTPLKDNKIDLFMGIGGCICTIIVGVVDYRVFKLFVDDEVQEKYFNKIKRKFIARTRKFSE